MVHCCLPVLFFAFNNKKGWIVSFLALPPPRCNTLLRPFSFHICQFSLCFELYIQSPSLALPASLLFIHPLVPLSVTNATRCHISLLSMCCPFICLLSLPPSCASFISLPLVVQNIDKQQSEEERPLTVTPGKKTHNI